MKYQIPKLIIPFLILNLVSCNKSDEYDLVIQNVGFFDGEQDQGIVNIGINADTIAAITPQPILADSIIDAKGKYIIPGLVDAHVHLSSIEEFKEGFNYGRLAILNMHTSDEERELKWKEISMDSMGFPVLYGSGYAATVPGGHPSQFSPGMETINDSITVEQWVDNRIANGADFIKIIRENHSYLGHPPQPTLSYDQIQKIINYTHSKGYKVIVHATQAKDFVEISKFKPDGFSHLWDLKLNSDLSPEDYQIIASSGAFIVPTAGFSIKPQNPPPHIKDWLEQNFLSAEQRIEVLNKLHLLGVTIVAGTDAQRGQMNFENDFYYELDMYKKSGLTNIEVLKTATGNAAKAFNLPIGILKIGSNANMVVLSANPLDDLDNLQKVEQVWKNGKRK